MPPKKKATNVDDLYDIFVRLSEAYEKQGDERRSKAFQTTSEAVKNLKEITCGKDIAKFKGVGTSSVEVVNEFLETGKCARLEELEGAGKEEEEEEQVALIRGGEASLELGVFKDDDGDENYLFLYEVGDPLKRALYKDADSYFDDVIDERQCEERNNYDGYGGIDDVREDIVESFAGFERLTDDYADDWSKLHHFVRKANANDLKRKDWEGDADVNWKKPNGITRDDLRDLFLARKDEDKHTEALEQLVAEENAFLEEAETDFKKALDKYPYSEMKYSREVKGGFTDLIVLSKRHENEFFDVIDGHQVRIEHDGDHEEAWVSITYGDCCLKAERTRYDEHSDPWDYRATHVKNGEKDYSGKEWKGEKDNIFDERHEFGDYMDEIFYEYRLCNSRF